MSEPLATHYANLQVMENASPEVIKGAYKHLTQKWHPDKNPHQREKAERITKMLNDAYETLIDPVRRREHDVYIADQRRRRSVVTPSPKVQPGTPTQHREPVMAPPSRPPVRTPVAGGGIAHPSAPPKSPVAFGFRGDLSGDAQAQGQNEVHLHYHQHAGSENAANRMRHAEAVARARTRFSFVSFLFEGLLASLVLWAFLKLVHSGIDPFNPADPFSLAHERWIAGAILVMGPFIYAFGKVAIIRRKMTMFLFNTYTADELVAMRDMGYRGAARLIVTLLVVFAATYFVWKRFI